MLLSGKFGSCFSFCWYLRVFFSVLSIGFFCMLADTEPPRWLLPLTVPLFLVIGFAGMIVGSIANAKLSLALGERLAKMSEKHQEQLKTALIMLTVRKFFWE